MLKNLISKYKNNKVMKNISWILICRIIHMLLSFLIGILSARYLGPSNYGLINYAAAYSNVFLCFCNLGINSVLVKEIIDNKGKEGAVLGTSLTLKFISSMLSFIIIQIIVFFVDSGDIITQSVVCLYSISLIFQIFDVFKYWFQSKLQSKYSEIASLIGYFAVAIYKIVLLMCGKSVEWFAFSNTLDFIVIAIFLIFIFRKKYKLKLSFDKLLAKQILSRSYHFIISGLMIAIYNSTDKFMLKFMINETEVGYYSTAVTISTLCTFLLSAIIESFNPIIIDNYNTNNEEFKRKNCQLYSIIFYLSSLISLFICIFGNLIINILYGADYINSLGSLVILTWYVAFSYLGVARDSWIICENKQKYAKYLYLIAAGLNVLINWLLIPKYGAVGASIATLITQFSTVFVFPYFIKPLRENVKLMFNSLILKNYWKKNNS